MNLTALDLIENRGYVFEDMKDSIALEDIQQILTAGQFRELVSQAEDYYRIKIYADEDGGFTVVPFGGGN